MDPYIVRPEGEIDPEIPLIGLRQNGSIKVLIANIVNHADTVGGCGVSADWPGFLIRELQPKLDADSMVMPLIGCSGNINHFDVRTDTKQTCYAEAERIGTGYSETIEEALPSLRSMPGAQLNIDALQVDVAPREIFPGEIAEAEKIVDKYSDIDVNRTGGPDVTAEDLADKTPYALKLFAVDLLKAAKNSEMTSFNLVKLDLGEAVIASVPCEPFAEVGLSIRKGIFGDRTAMVVSHANGSGTGYIPNCWNYGRGGYETTPRSNPYTTKTSEILLAAWRELSLNYSPTPPT